MKDNFVNRMFSSSGDTSLKRVLAFIFSCFAIWAGCYIVVNYKEYALTVFGYTLIIIGLLTGLFTLPEIVALIKGTLPPPKEDKPNSETTEN